MKRAASGAWKMKNTKRKSRLRDFSFWLGCRDSNPGNVRVRVWCLTAWRHPNIFNIRYYITPNLLCQYLFWTFLKKLFAFSWRFRIFVLFHFTKYVFCGTIHKSNQYLPVAQLDSASDSDSEGQRFESVRVGQNKAGGTVPPALFLSTRMVKRNVTPREACVRVQNPFG